MRHPSIFVLVALIGTGAATADTAYVKPSSFEGSLNKTVTIDVSFSDACCEPSYPVRTDTYVIINPDATSVSPDRIETFDVKTVLEHKLTQEGTTRISTGERLGRKGEYVFLDDEYHLVNSPDAELQVIPEGTPILTSQTATVTDAYVSVGEKTWDAVNFPIGRLTITLFTHPNTIQVGEVLKGQITFDGQPVSDQSVLLTTEAQRLEGRVGDRFETDDQGQFSIPINEQGTALVMTRMQATSPDGADTDIRSYTTAITFNIIED